MSLGISAAAWLAAGVGAAGVGASVYGANQSARAARDQQNMLAQQAANSRTDLGVFNYMGPGGGSALVDQGGLVSSQLGAQDQSIYDILGRLGGQTAGQVAGGGGMPSAMQQAFRASQEAARTGQVFDRDQFLAGLQGNIGQQFETTNDAYRALQQGGFNRDLASTAFRGAGQQLGYAMQDPTAVRDQTLSNLRAQAQPFEQRAFDTLQNDQFGMGRLGTTGGGIQTEAFARGLGQADLPRQLAANQEGRNYQQNALGLAQGALGQGMGISGMEDQLLNSVFNRFGATANLGMGVTGERFQNSLAMNQLGFDRSQSLLQNELLATQLPRQLQGMDLNFLSQVLGQRSAFNQQGLQGMQAALAAAQAGANARIGAGSNVAALTGLAAQLPTSQDMWGNVLTGAGARLAQNGPPDWLTGLFSNMGGGSGGGGGYGGGGGWGGDRGGG